MNLAGRSPIRETLEGLQEKPKRAANPISHQTACPLHSDSPMLLPSEAKSKLAARLVSPCVWFIDGSAVFMIADNVTHSVEDVFRAVGEAVDVRAGRDAA